MIVQLKQNTKENVTLTNWKYDFNNMFRMVFVKTPIE